MHKTARTAIVALFLIGAGVVPASAGGNSESFDRRADAVTRRMSNYIARLQSFRFTSQHTTEVVLENGQKLEFGATSRVEVKRPNMFRSQRVGEAVEATLFYDGKSLTIFTPRTNTYATAPAPPTLDAAVDFAREKLGMETPAGDLVLSDVFGMLTKDSVGSMYVGRVLIDGVWCDHVAYRGKETDFQLWIEEGERPLPRKYVITSKNVQQSPEFGVVLEDWVTDAEVSEKEFTFVPPKGAERIEFLALAELPKTKESEDRGSR
jgi:hypothetical protein